MLLLIVPFAHFVKPRPEGVGEMPDGDPVAKPASAYSAAITIAVGLA